MMMGGALASLSLMALAYEDQGADAVHQVAEQAKVAVAAVTLQRKDPHAVPQPAVIRERQGDKPAWKQFAVASNALPGQPMIAIVIDDMGIDGPRTRAIIDLPAPVTTSFLPYGRHSAQLAPLARAGGHELLVHLPMQPKGNEADPGPHALMLKMSAAEIDRQLNWNLSRFAGYVGVNNHMGSAFTRNEADMHEVLRQLNKRGLLFLDSRTTSATATKEASAHMSLPLLKRDIFLDNVRQERAIWLQLKAVEMVAKAQGYAIAIGHPYDATARVLKAWMPRASDEGFALVPLSAIVGARQKTQLAQR